MTAARRTAIPIIVLAALALPAAASAKHGGRDDDEVRAAGTCGGGARSTLKLKARNGGIEAEAEVEHARRGSSWRVVLAQEGRVVWRGTVRAGRSSGAFSVERRLRDLAGADRVSLRASGPGGVTCRATATLAGD